MNNGQRETNSEEATTINDEGLLRVTGGKEEAGVDDEGDSGDDCRDGVDSERVRADAESGPGATRKGSGYVDGEEQRV